MPFVSTGPDTFRLVSRSHGFVRGCVFVPTLMLGAFFAAGAVRGLLLLERVLRGPRPATTSGVLAFVLAGGLLMALFALFGLTGRSEVVVDARRGRVAVTLRAFGLRLRHREHDRGAFDRVEVRSGVGRSAPDGPSHRFHFAALRGPSAAVALERLGREEALRQADDVARWLGLPRGPDDAG